MTRRLAIIATCATVLLGGSALALMHPPSASLTPPKSKSVMTPEQQAWFYIVRPTVSSPLPDGRTYYLMSPSSTVQAGQRGRWHDGPPPGPPVQVR
jgi:hypothetical protein